MTATPFAFDLARRHQADLLAEAQDARDRHWAGDRAPAAGLARAALLLLVALVLVVALLVLGADPAAAGWRNA